MSVHALTAGSNVLPKTGHAEQDSFIPKAHSERLVAAYAGDANMVTFGGDHNSHRPAFFHASVLIFLHAVLRMPQPLPAAEAAAAAARQGGCAGALFFVWGVLGQICRGPWSSASCWPGASHG